jgi:hypothetical protein
MLRNEHALHRRAGGAFRLFDAMFAAFAAQGIPADGLTSEAGRAGTRSASPTAPMRWPPPTMWCCLVTR